MFHQIKDEETEQLFDQVVDQAVKAEKKQAWCLAAMLWRRIGEIEQAESCENIAQYLAINDMRILQLKSHSFYDTKTEKTS